MSISKLEEMIEFTKPYLESKGFEFKFTSDKNRFKISKNNNQNGIILLDKQLSLNELVALHNKNKAEYGKNLVIFYKDGQTFFKRMVENSSWRSDKSLKKYTENEINHIIALTVQERYALFDFSKYIVDNFTLKDLENKQLNYYQTQTPNLSKSIRKFNALPVEFDYSHIKSGDRGYGFTNDKYSKTYFFLDQINNK